MKKKIIAVAALSMLFATVANASSLNGDYDGNPIVNVKSNGMTLQADEVPAMIYNGHTVVPIAMLRQLGASVTWDQQTYSVDVSLPSKYTPKEIADYVGSNLVDFVTITASSTTNFVQMQCVVKFDLTNSDTTDLNRVMAAAVLANAKILDMTDRYTHELKVDVDKYVDFINGKITSDEFLQSYDTSDSPVYTPNGGGNTNQTQQPTSVQQNGYTLNDALIELGVTGGATPTVDMKNLAIQLMEIRKTKNESDYSVQDALRDLGIPQGATPTLNTLIQAVKLIQLH